MDGATGLKNVPLAYVLKVKIPELHFAGRPPNKNQKKWSPSPGVDGRAGRAGRLRGRAVGRFVAFLT